MGNTRSEPNAFQVGLTDDDVYGHIMDTPSACQMLDKEPRIETGRLAATGKPVEAQVLDRFDAVMAGGMQFTRETCQGVERCTLIVRFGAGYDRVDVEACTEAGIIVANTPEGIRRSMSTTALTHILALTTRFVDKARMLRAGQWKASQQSDCCGMGLTGRTVGYIGFGNIGSDLHRLMLPFNVRHLVYDPYIDPTKIEHGPIEQVELATLLRESDVVAILCTLTDETRHLIGTTELQLMKPTAYLVNIARGAIVDQEALTRALTDGQIRGAGLDALDPEPIDPHDPLLELDNVILTPHSIGITDEMMRGCSEGCVEAVLAVMRGEVPDFVINRDVLDRPALRTKLESFQARYSG